MHQEKAGLKMSVIRGRNQHERIYELNEQDRNLHRDHTGRQSLNESISNTYENH